MTSHATKAKEHPPGIPLDRLGRPKRPLPPGMEARKLKPGQQPPGGAAGKPRGALSMTARLRKVLTSGNGELADMLIRAMVREADGGSYHHLKEIIDRIDGTLVQQVQVTSAVERLLDIAQRVLPHDHYAALLEAISADGASPQALSLTANREDRPGDTDT